MPNHCESDLHIHGDPEALKAFMDFAQGPAGTVVGTTDTTILSAHKFIPLPDEYLAEPYTCEGCGLRLPKVQLANPDGFSPPCPQCGEHMKDWYNSGGYDWCIAHWGTKWGIYDVELLEGDFEDGRLEYTFQSAWSPPVPVIEAMSKRFPSLTFALDYFEGGSGFMGSAAYASAQLTEEGTAPYHGPRGG